MTAQPLPVFMDTSGLVALSDRSDRHHTEASLALRAGIQNQIRWITTNYVMGEALTYLRMRAGHHAAEQFGDRLRGSALLNVVWIDEALDQLVWEYFMEHRHHTFSYVHCASFVVMRREAIHLALAFDERFAQAGFQFFRG